MTNRYGERLRNVRIADGLWADALAISRARGETLSGVIRAALTRYVARHRALLEEPPAKARRRSR